MHDPLFISYHPDGDGGVTIELTYGERPGGPRVASVDLDHRGALTAAAHILHKAGVVRAEFEGTRIQEMSRQ